MRDSVYEIVSEAAQSAPRATALIGAGNLRLSYEDLAGYLRAAAANLRAVGVGPADRVAVVLPNGPEMATTFLAVGAAACCAPLNPAYRKDELSFFLDDLSPALLITADEHSPAAECARERGIRIQPPLALDRFDRGGAFDDWGRGAAASLALHTSGTTSRPKLVPLSHANLTASAANIAATLRLTPQDRCLNVMPLFHIHGLIGGLLSTLSAGAEFVATEGFQPLKFFAWLDEYRPTWYTAVPTMHQAVLARSARNPEVLERVPLRLIRSSSASLPPSVMAALEETFKAPVIESYGMTEAAHQMASNPLPPGERKPGSVGPAAGPEIAILDNDGRLLPQGQIGEVAIRGRNVTAGYADNPDANASAFTNGWFRTGDQGRLDADGYLVLTGRLKEIINRGGEKISPREIDEVLLHHPAVQQAVAFAAPHEKLGEEVAAAIVLRDGQSASEKELRDFAAASLADFKVPRKFVFLDEIPKGPTGKLQRIGLAKQLGLG